MEDEWDRLIDRPPSLRVVRGAPVAPVIPDTPGTNVGGLMAAIRMGAL